MIADVYALVGELSAKRPAVIVLDEFQAIVDLGAHLPGLFKSLADAHPKVALVVAGSKKHLMDQLVVAPSAALYNMAERLALGPLPGGVMGDYLRTRARTGGKSMTGEVATRIIERAGPIPNDIQRLAYEAYDLAGPGIDHAAVDGGLARVVAHESDTFAERFEHSPPVSAGCWPPWPKSRRLLPRRRRSPPALASPTIRRSARRSPRWNTKSSSSAVGAASK